MNVKEFYDCNADFKCYVDRYCSHYQISIGEALKHSLVLEVATHYMNGTTQENDNVERLKQACQEVKMMREGNIPKRSYHEFKQRMKDYVEKKE